ncbi:MAG TPA: hypothetical protein VNI20_04755 [Fimbriimonadaceae bacterium]|nr:hypothetical protein [Fimbriimonadaceae bacterium]
MARSIEKIKFGLKLRTDRKENALTVKIGTKKYALPYEVRTITSDDYVFVHVPPAAEILKIGSKGLEPVTKSDEAEKAVQSFRKARRSRRRARRSKDLPEDVKNILKAKIPAGHKIGYDAEGNLKLVKTRKRRAKAAAKPKAATARKKSTRRTAKKR